MIIQSQKDLSQLRKIGAIVANCLQYMLSQVEVDLPTDELDRMGRAFLEKEGAKPAPEVMYKFPGATCISLNQEAAHGIPSPKKIIKAGDIINIDVSAVLDGYFADTGGSMVISPANEVLKQLCKATKRALNRSLEHVRADAPINVIGKAIEKEARRSGFSVIKNLCSHGVGKSLHEDPEYIAGYYNPKERRRLVENMVITIEPFLSNGTEFVDDACDGWALLNKPGCFSAQYEHSLVVTRKSPILLTVPS